MCLRMEKCQYLWRQGVFAPNSQIKSLSKHPPFYSNNPRRMQSAKTRLYETSDIDSSTRAAATILSESKKREGWRTYKIRNIRKGDIYQLISLHHAQLDLHSRKHIVTGKGRHSLGISWHKEMITYFILGVMVDLNTNFLSFRDAYLKHLEDTWGLRCALQ